MAESLSRGAAEREIAMAGDLPRRGKQVRRIAATLLDGPDPIAVLTANQPECEMCRARREAVEIIEAGGGIPITDEHLAWYERGQARATEDLTADLAPLLAAMADWRRASMEATDPITRAFYGAMVRDVDRFMPTALRETTNG